MQYYTLPNMTITSPPTPPPIKWAQCIVVVLMMGKWIVKVNYSLYMLNIELHRHIYILSKCQVSSNQTISGICGHSCTCKL